MIKKIAVIFFVLILIVSCKKINLLSSAYIPPPTAFPNISEVPDYPIPTPIPTPPDKVEEKPIKVTPEIVPDNTVFGGYSKRFKYKNEWYVLATNQYKYDADTKKLTPTGKGALLKIGNDGSTISKIYTSPKDTVLDSKQYWLFLISDQLIIEANKVKIISLAYTTTDFDYTEDKNFIKGNIDFSLKDIFVVVKNFIEHKRYMESDDLINWRDTVTETTKTYKMPNTNHIEPNFLGRYGLNVIEYFMFYYKGKIFLYKGFKNILDEYPDGYKDPSDPSFDFYANEYYTIDYGKDISDAKNWTTNYFPDYNGTKLLYVNHFAFDENKLYLCEANFGNSVYEYDGNLWQQKGKYVYTDKYFSSEDGVNWKEDTKPTSDYLKILTSDVILASYKSQNVMGGYNSPDAAPLEPSYTELNGRYYGTFNATYPIPPIKEIKEAADRLETNFTITEEHIKKSGAYQLQVSSVPPDKSGESDWVSVIPNNEINSVIGWQSGGADLFTFNNKIVRLVDYDRVFQIDNQYETSLNLSKQYYEMLKTAENIEIYKQYNYYFLYYKAIADMLKMIKDKGNNYFYPDEAVTHYTFEL